MQSFPKTALLFTTVFCLFSTPFAEPFLAVINGMKCSQCHVNKTGGGKRTEFGSIFTQTMLPGTVKSSETQFDKNLSPTIKTGANLRLAANGSIPEASADGEVSMTVPEGNVYVQMDMVQDFLSLYVDQTVAPNVTNREAFIMVEPGETGYIKAGKMLQPYGLRIWDDATYTRKISGFSYGTPSVGVEFGMEPGPISMSASITNSQASAMLYHLFSDVPVIGSFRIGGSVFQEYGQLYNLADGSLIDNYDQFALGAGVFGGWKIWQLAWLFEWNWKRTPLGTGTKWEQYGLAEVNWMATKGLYFRLGYDWSQPHMDVAFSQNAKGRVVAGADWFPMQYIGLGAYYYYRDSFPQDVSGSQDGFQLQLHAFY